VTAADQSGAAEPSYDRLPEWLRPLAHAALHVRPEELSRFLPPDEGGRESAVLMLFGESRPGWDGADVLLIERAHDMRSHAGQVAFPGGADSVSCPTATVCKAVGSGTKIYTKN